MALEPLHVSVAFPLPVESINIPHIFLIGTLQSQVFDLCSSMLSAGKPNENKRPLVPRQAFLWLHRRRFTSFLKFSPKKISIADAPPTRTYLSAPYLWLKVENAFT